MIAALLLAASHVLGVCPETGVAEYYGSDELSAKVKEPLERRTYPVERTTDADRDAAMKALAGVKTIVVWHWNNARRIREIRDSAFEGAPDLERVLLRSGVRRVGSRVFAGCPRLVSVISECNAELDIADDAFTGVTNAVTLIECGPDRRHEILAGRGPFARVIKLDRAVHSFEHYASSSRTLHFAGPFISGNWVYMRGDRYSDDDRLFGNAVLELALKPEEVKLFPKEIDGFPVTHRNDRVVPEADARRIRESEQAFKRGIAEGAFTYRIVDGEAQVFKYSGDRDAGRECVVLPEKLGGCPVTEVSELCFAGLGELRRLVLPPGLKAVPDGMCLGCPNLVAVDIPASVRRIGRCAFYGCPSLDRPNLGTNVAVGEWAFSGRDIAPADVLSRYTGADGKVVVDVLAERRIRVDFFGEKSKLEAGDRRNSRAYSENGAPKFLFDADWHFPWISEAALVNDRPVGIGTRIALSREKKSVEERPDDGCGLRHVRSLRSYGPLSDCPPRHLNRSFQIDPNQPPAPIGMRCGYDLAVGDWVKPRGRGTFADLYVTVTNDPARIMVEAGESTEGFHLGDYIKDRKGPIPGFGREVMSGRPIIIDSASSACWLWWPPWGEPSGTMSYFTARGIPAALNWMVTRESQCDKGAYWRCGFSISVNPGIVPAPEPPDCDADLVETAEGTAVCYGGWAHPPVNGHEVTDTNAIQRLIVDGIVDEIPEGAFKGLKGLRQVVFRGSARIGRQAFADCPQLCLIHDTSSLGIIAESDSFVGCATNLTHVVYDAYADGVKLFSPKCCKMREVHTSESVGRNSNSNLSLEGDFLFLDDGRNIVLLCYFGSEETVCLPKTGCGSPVTKIAKGAFQKGGKTRKVILPKQSIRFPDSNGDGQKSFPEFVTD